MKKPSKMWSCERKIRYEAKPPANRHVEPYACAYCGGWHMRTTLAKIADRVRPPTEAELARLRKRVTE